ncbi:trehalose-6-phosphate synthase, partial [Mesorhizobium sp. M4B.F.Ca.ET.088.02.2.1]
MTDQGIDLLWGLLLVSLGLSALAVFLSISRHRRNSTPATVHVAGEDVASEAARKVLREFEKNGQSVDAALVTWSPETLRKILHEDLPE